MSRPLSQLGQRILTKVPAATVRLDAQRRFVSFIEWMYKQSLASPPSSPMPIPQTSSAPLVNQTAKEFKDYITKKPGPAAPEHLTTAKLEEWIKEKEFEGGQGCNWVVHHTDAEGPGTGKEEVRAETDPKKMKNFGARPGIYATFGIGGIKDYGVYGVVFRNGSPWTRVAADASQAFCHENANPNPAYGWYLQADLEEAWLKVTGKPLTPSSPVSTAASDVRRSDPPIV